MFKLWGGLLLLVLASLHAGWAQAALWQTQHSLRLGAVYESQPSYNRNYAALKAATLNWQANVTRSTQRNQFDAMLKLYQEDSQHLQRREQDSIKTQLSYRYNWELSQFNVSSSYQDSSVNTELESQGLGLLLDQDVGRYESDLNLSYQYLVSPKASLNIATYFNKLSYQYQPPNLSDSYYYVLSLSWSQQLSERWNYGLSGSRLSSFSSVASAQPYSVQPPSGNAINLLHRFERDNQNINDSVKFSLSYEPSERQSLSLQLGYRTSQLFGQRLQQTNLVAGQVPMLTGKGQRLSNNSGRSAGLDYSYNSECSNFALTLNNELVPSSNAGIIERDNLSVIYSYYIKQTIKAYLNGRFGKQTNPLNNSSLGYQTRDFYLAKLGLDFRLGQYHGLVASIERRQQRDDGADFLSNNVYRLQWWYKPQIQHW